MEVCIKLSNPLQTKIHYPITVIYTDTTINEMNWGTAKPIKCHVQTTAAQLTGVQQG